MPVSHRLALTHVASALALSLFAWQGALAQTRTPAPTSPEIDAAYTRLTASPLIRKVLDDIKADDARAQREPGISVRHFSSGPRT